MDTLQKFTQLYQCSETKVLVHLYSEKHGHTPHEKQVNQDLANYQRDGIVPSYVLDAEYKLKWPT